MTLIETLSLAGLSTKTSATLPTSGYRHLRLIGQIRSTRAGVDNSATLIRLNGDTAANYVWQLGYAFNTTIGAALTASSTDLVTMETPGATSPAGACGVIDLSLPLYRGTDFNKAGVCIHAERINATTSGYRIRTKGVEWKNAAAITSITLTEANSANWATGSFLDIYGIA